MESIAPAVGSLPGFETYPHTREGFTIIFRGNAPNEQGEYEGEFVAIELTIPPLPLYKVRQIQDPQNLDVIELVFMALKRNYRGVPKWLVEQTLDGPAMRAFDAKMREMNGLPSEKQPAGTASP